MTLPGAEHALIEPEKVRDYLLSFEHPVGRAKARYFAAFGFVREDWPRLRNALLALAANGQAEMGEHSAFGQKYLVRGTIQGPSGRAAPLVTVWIVLTGDKRPRFVTAYPAEES